jgi:hypothetical protein
MSQHGGGARLTAALSELRNRLRSGLFKQCDRVFFGAAAHRRRTHHHHRRPARFAPNSCRRWVAVVMNEDIKTLLSGGYCFSIKDSGPFVIGEDFEAPGPADRLVPRMKIDREKWDELWSFVERGAESKADDGSDKAIFEDVTKRLAF